MKGVRRMDITEAKIMVKGFGKDFMYSAFKENEKERASKIVEQLKGMTIREAQEFLSRVSDALIDVHML